MRSSEAFCPGGISSFFEICNTDPTGRPLTDPLHIGARGGGFAIKRGVHVHVAIRKSAKKRIKVQINSNPTPFPTTTHYALTNLVERFQLSLEVRVDIVADVPISAGFGTSAAGTAASCLALADAARLPITMNELGQVTHMAEVVNGTGLGTASAIFVGGFPLVTEPGAPGIGCVDRLTFPRAHSIICVYLGPMSKRDTLGEVGIAARVNGPAQRAMNAIRARPELTNFLTQARRFSEESGFQTPEVKHVLQIMVQNGASGAAQNMIGRAVHGVAEDRKARRIAHFIRRSFPSAKVFVTKLDNAGARLE